MQRLIRFVGDVPSSPLRAALLRRSIGLFGLALVAATWRLWTPQTVFPQVPLFRAASGLPPWCEWLGAAGMVAGLAGALAAPRGRLATASLVTFAASAAGMILVDQQRLQPWAYQFILLALVLALAEPRGAFVLLRLLIVSFYFHSALTKLDYAFLHTLGQQFLAVLAGTCGLSPEDWSAPARLAGAAVFPVGEMLVAAGLLFAPTRTIGLAGAVTLHVLLLVILGPLGLDHKPGVLVWNAYFIVQDLLLFWPARRPKASSGRTDRDAAPALAPGVPWSACALVGAAIVLPFLEPVGWFDMWPSWGLYAASAERVALEVHRRELDRWPQELRGYLEASADPREPWMRVRLDRWSLDVLGVPVYPQNRVQLGLAAGVVARFGLGHRARVIRFDQAARFTGKRHYTVFRGLAQLESAGDEYFFNARPRGNMD
jgi:hypothetical protein